MPQPPTTHVPPQNIEAEESVLGAMMISPGAIGAVSEILDASDFYRESHAKVYRAALALRRKFGLGNGAVEWLESFGDDVVALRNGAITVIANTGSTPVHLPAGEVAIVSEPLATRQLPADTTAWLIGRD